MTGKPLLLHVFPGFAVGGAQMRFVQIANHFGGDYRHVIVSLNGNDEAFHRLSPDLDARMVEVPVVKGATLPNIRTYRTVLRELAPDLLVTSNWGSIEWAMANWDGRVRHLHMEDGFGPEEANRQIPRRVWTRRLTLRRSTVMLPSINLFHLARDVWRLPRRTICHIPNGIDCDRFASGADRSFASAMGLTEGSPIIGTVAALRSEKNLLRLIDAFALVADNRPARLAIVGDGAEKEALRARAIDRGVAGSVIFTGACREPEKLLGAMSVFALSSDTEQMPISILEAMAAGLPVASTDVGDVRRMLVSDNDRFVVPRDASALAGAIAGLLDDPGTAAAIGAANARRARDVYDQSLMFAAYRTLFDGGDAGAQTRPS
ncbi:MAG: glycosyltransferase [Telmatospirillum sp.]|nr:glycosyltransferase [Telmatospirillum sp.]